MKEMAQVVGRSRRCRLSDLKVSILEIRIRFFSGGVPLGRGELILASPTDLLTKAS